MAMTSDSPEMVDPIAVQLAAYRTKLELEPSNGVLWLEYGDFVAEEYDLPHETVRAYENAAKLLPKKDIRARIGAAYVDAGDSDVGLALIKQSVTENPRAHAFCILAGAYLKMADYESAKKAAEQAIILDSEFEEAYYLLGDATRHFSHEDAIGSFRAAIERDASYALAWQALGRELATDSATLDEAILALRRAVELDPKDGWAMAYLANSLWKRDCTNEAAQWYERAIGVFPDCEDVRRWYEQFLNEQIKG